MLMCLEFKMQKARYDWCIYRWKCKKQGTNNVFRNRNANNKNARDIQRSWNSYNRLYRLKGTIHVFKVRNITNKIQLSYLKSKKKTTFDGLINKIWKVRYDLCI